MLYHADFALVGNAVLAGVVIAVADGRLARVEQGAKPAGAEGIAGLVLPGMANVHGHAFQRAFAGLAEWDKQGAGNFWSWREAMYRFAEKLAPETARAVAAYLYLEQLKAGYTAAAEFHYLHRRSGGAPYAPPSAMMDAIVEAADDSGIALTLLPALYMTGGADGRALAEAQRRFGNSVDEFLRLAESVRPRLGRHRMGLAFHSLRAVPAHALRETLAAWPRAEPVHIHAAEQVREVEDCVAAFGRRPVEFLLELGLDRRWCLVHATHLTEGEIAGLARSGAVAGLCPLTEANLGDGVFPLAPYLGAGGRIAIGGDSHVSTDPAEELRQLEYAQRLVHLRRNVAASVRTPHTGVRLWAEAARGGADALGLDSGELRAGARADLVVLDPDHVSLAGREGEFLVDSYVFVAGGEAVRDVMVAGEWIVKNRVHPREDELREACLGAVRRLSA